MGRATGFVLATLVASLLGLPPTAASDADGPHRSPDNGDSGTLAAAAVPELSPVIVSVGTADPPPLQNSHDAAVVSSAHRGDGSGWVVTSGGQIEAFGGAPHLGDMSHVTLNRPIVAMAATPSGAGYWLAATDGGIFAFGDAGFHGSTGHLTLARPIVDMEAATDGAGYLLAADDGGVFAFGSARFEGSMGAVALNEPIVGIGRPDSGVGYWLVARDGGIFAFGGAGFFGSSGSEPPSRDVVDLVESPGADGYWLVTEGAGVVSFGGAPPLAGPPTLGGRVVAAATHDDGLWLTVHPQPPMLFAWQSGGLSAAVAPAILAAAAEAGATAAVSHSGTLGVHEIRRGQHLVEAAPPGWQRGFTARAVPVATAEVFHGPQVAAALGRGEVVMSRRSARLRDARQGDTVIFSGWDGRVHSRVVGAVVDESRVGWSELTFGAEDAASFGFVRPSSIWVTNIGDLATLENGLAQLAVAEPWVRWSKSWDAPGVDGTLPTVVLKELLGDFSYRLASSGTVEIDPAWVAANIVRADLPILGRWRCHRAILDDLTAALSAIEQQGLAHLIDVRDSRYGGCWVARRIRGASGGALSRHAFGVALDINPSSNAWGAAPTMDPRIVSIFRANGFAWGGTWTRPDGMHFEWVGR